MKVRDLIKILQSLDPESSVSFSLGRDDEYRAQCAKAELARGDCFECLNIDRIEIYDDGNLWADIVLELSNLLYMGEAAEEFDEQYVKKERN